MDFAELIDFLRDDKNREVLAWLGGGASVAVGGLWAATKFFLARGTKSADAEKTSSTKPTDDGTATAGTDVAATGDVLIEGGLRITRNEIPKGAIALIALGFLVLVFAVFQAGDSVVVQNGSYVGGDVKDSTIEVETSPQSEGGSDQ